MKHAWQHRLLTLALAACTIFGLGLPAQAASIADGSKTCAVALAPVHNYLTTTAGTSLRAGGYNYTTNDGLTGPAYCIDHGLAYTGKTLPITGKYAVSPATAGAFANGYPQHSLETFLELYLDENSILSGLTEAEYRYATQVAVWATLGQLAIDGTPYTSGRERLAYPTGDTQQMRVFVAAQLICNVAKDWDRVYQSGMYIRLDENKLGGNEEIPPDMTLEYAAEVEQYGIKREVIGGKAYFTKEYIFASASWTEYILHITITAKTAEDMKTAYGFTAYQISAMDELLADRAALSSRAGSLAITNVDALTVLNALPDGLALDRHKAVETALQLVGKVGAESPM